MQFINPKVVLFCITIFPSFVMPYYNTINELMIFAFIVAIIGTLSYFAWVLFGSLLKKAKEIIYYYLHEVLDIDEISKELNISKFQFIRIFKANTGITPYQYFLNCKMIHAKNHLYQTRDLYGTVVQFGFTDLSHLNRHFKRVYGVTAFEYITQI